MPEPVVVSAVRGATLRIEVCPNGELRNGERVCHCARAVSIGTDVLADPERAANLEAEVRAAAPIAPHPIFEYPATPPDTWPTAGKREAAMRDYLRQCAEEAMRSVASENAHEEDVTDVLA